MSSHKIKDFSQITGGLLLLALVFYGTPGTAGERCNLKFIDRAFSSDQIEFFRKVNVEFAKVMAGTFRYIQNQITLHPDIEYVRVWNITVNPRLISSLKKMNFSEIYNKELSFLLERSCWRMDFRMGVSQIPNLD